MWVSLCAVEGVRSGKAENVEVIGEGASGNGSSIGLSILFLELDLAALCENCGPETTRLARVCSFCAGGVAAMPEARAMEVCMHRRNGELCITTLCFLFRFGWSLRGCSGDCEEEEGSSASRFAMRTPRLRHCVQPP